MLKLAQKWALLKRRFDTFLLVFKNPVEPARIFCCCAASMAYLKMEILVIFSAAKIIICKLDDPRSQKSQRLWKRNRDPQKLRHSNCSWGLVFLGIFPKTLSCSSRLWKDCSIEACHHTMLYSSSLSAAHIGIDIKTTLFCNWYSSSYVLKRLGILDPVSH